MLRGGPGLFRAVRHAIRAARQLHHGNVVFVVAHEHQLLGRPAGELHQALHAPGLVHIRLHHVVIAGAVGHEFQAQIAVFLLEFFHLLRRQDGEGTEGHAFQMPVLILAVQHILTVSGGLFVKLPHCLVFHIDVVVIRKIEGQRIVEILEEVHQRIHLLGGQILTVQKPSLPVQNLGAVGADHVVRLDAAQNLRLDGKAGCEETYNDKLFWPGELCQEYGSYIKPANLNLTYSGEKLVGKTVDFKTEDSEKGTLTLNDIIPGEKQTPLPISLCEQEDSYTFSGKNITMGGATVTYSGAITPKTMKLELDVVMPQSKWKKSYGISNFTKGKKMTVTYSGGQYVWKETNEILTGGFYVHLDDVELTKAGSTLFLRMKLIQNALCYFIPQLLQTITLQPDGNLVANYTTSPVYIGSVPINNIDPDKDVGTIATFVTKFMIGLLTEKDINNALTDRTWTASPINLITWTEENGKLKINLNLPAIISLATKDGETPIDSGLVSGIMEALAQSNPVQLKLLLGIVNSMIDNPLLGIITSMDTASFQQVFYLLTEGIIFHIEEEDGHTHLYLTKESTTAFIQLLPGLQPIVEGMLPESMANNTVFKNLLGLLMGNDENGLPVLWNAANTIDLGLDLLPQE